MGCVSVFGGFTGLRLPETLHHRLPQTLEEGEQFGKDWTFKDCCRCVPLKPMMSRSTSSYENLTDVNKETVFELNRGVSTKQNKLSESSRTVVVSEKTALEVARTRRQSMKRLVRQTSVMDTQMKRDGAMQLTYWF